MFFGHVARLSVAKEQKAALKNKRDAAKAAKKAAKEAAKVQQTVNVHVTVNVHIGSSS